MEEENSGRPGGDPEDTHHTLAATPHQQLQKTVDKDIIPGGSLTHSQVLTVGFSFLEIQLKCLNQKNKSGPWPNLFSNYKQKIIG